MRHFHPGKPRGLFRPTATGERGAHNGWLTANPSTLDEDIEYFSKLANEDTTFGNPHIDPVTFPHDTFNQWLPSLPEQSNNNRSHVSLSQPHPQALTSNPISEAGLLRTHMSNPELQPHAVSSNKDRLLSNKIMTYQALLLEERSQQLHHLQQPRQPNQRSNPASLQLQASFGSYQAAAVPYSPTRPERPHSDVDSFIANQPMEESLRSHHSHHSAPAPTLKRPPAPVMPRRPEPSLLRPAPTAPRSISSPPAPNARGCSTMKHVSMAPPPIRIDNPDYKPPEQYTPFPFAKVQTAARPASPPGPAPTHDLPEPPRRRLATPPLPPLTPPPEIPQQPNHPISTSLRHVNHRNYSHLRHVSRSRSADPAKKRRSNPYSVHAQAVSSTTSGPAKQAVLRLVVRRRQALNGRRTATVSIPQETSVAESKGGNEKQFASLEFDDAVLFTQMRRQYYHSLIGGSWVGRFWRRWGSARTLKRVRLVQHGGEIASWRVIDTEEALPEQELMALFKRPKDGKGAYSWVHWAQKFVKGAEGGTAAAAEAKKSIDEAERGREGNKFSMHHGSVSGSTLDLRKEQREEKRGDRCLEFMEAWCIRRIVLAFSVVLLAAVAICVVWILVGPAVDWRGIVWMSGSSIQRVIPGCLLGLLVTTLGLSCIALWAWLSWLVM